MQPSLFPSNEENPSNTSRLPSPTLLCECARLWKRRRRRRRRARVFDPIDTACSPIYSLEVATILDDSMWSCAYVAWGVSRRGENGPFPYRLRRCTSIQQHSNHKNSINHTNPSVNVIVIRNDRVPMVFDRKRLSCAKPLARRLFNFTRVLS